MKELSPSFRRWIAALAWIAAIFVFSSRESGAAPGFAHADKLFHAAEFGILSVLVARALLPSIASFNIPAFQAWAAAALLCFLYALSDEAHQAFVPGRSCETLDAAADLVGIFLGLGTLKLYMFFRGINTPP